MNYYQIVEKTALSNHAGSKAVVDVADILEKNDFYELGLYKRSESISRLATLQRQIGYFQDWKNIYRAIPNKAVVVLQHPFHNKQLTREKTLRRLKDEKHVKFISLIHDIEELRQLMFNDYYAEEFKVMLDLADVIICHNQVMKDFIVQKGYSSERIVILEIFDYLHATEIEKDIEYKQSITVAGNLDTKKSPYIAQLVKIPNLVVDLYGPNFDTQIELGVESVYHGSYPADEVPLQLNKGFGLVWDGSSIHTCTDNTGNYLRYNSPHKLSLYLSSELPVIVWQEAACASLVNKYNLGYTISSLEELPDLLSSVTQERYESLVNSVRSFGAKLRQGYFTEKAIQESLKLIEEAQ